MLWTLCSRALAARAPQETAQAYLDFITAWTQECDFCGCMFINACGEYSAADSLPHRYAQAHKQEIRAALRSRLDGADIAEAERIADMLFVCGEGMIVAAQTGQHIGTAPASVAFMFCKSM